jgi:YbgC/YbaW family acyl-CoA thioester hydrolase
VHRSPLSGDDYVDVKLFWVQKKVHWSDCDAAGIAWFANYFRWFEDAEEALFAEVLGRTRQSLLDELRFAMPRVDATAKYLAPVRPGETIRVGIACTLEHPRRLRHDFEIRTREDVLLARGFVRVACVDSANFTPRDLPPPVIRVVEELPHAAERQGTELPWT